MGYIYAIINIVNGKIYIGATRNIEGRYLEHTKRLRERAHSNELLQSDYDLYGDWNFRFKVLATCEEEELGNLEIEYIIKNDSVRYGYNKTLGGEGFGVSSLKIAQSINPTITSHDSEWLLEKKSKKTKSFGWVKGKNPKAKKVVCLNTGEHFDCIADAAEKYGVNYICIVQCCTHRNIGVYSERGNCKSEKLVWRYEKEYNKLSQQEVDKIVYEVNNVEREGRKVRCVNTGEVFISAQSASRKYNVDNSGILKVCKGRLKCCGTLPNGEKMIWEYAED